MGPKGLGGNPPAWPERQRAKMPMAQTRGGRAVANQRLQRRATSAPYDRAMDAGYAAALSRLVRTRGGARLSWRFRQNHVARYTG